MAISNPISKANLVGRYNDFVADTANAGLSGGTNNKPTLTYSGTSYSRIRAADEDEVYGGGTTGGAGDTASSVLAGTVIDASDIYSKLCAATNSYTNLRNVGTRFYIQGAGGNSGTISTPTSTFETEASISSNYGYTIAGGGFMVGTGSFKSHMNTSVRTSIAYNAASTFSLTTGDQVNDTNLELFFGHLEVKYQEVEGTDYDTYLNWTCHTSCHSSCHGSRGRR